MGGEARGGIVSGVGQRITERKGDGKSIEKNRIPFAEVGKRRVASHHAAKGKKKFRVA